MTAPAQPAGPEAAAEPPGSRSSRPARSAVVIGGGISGLLAARELSRRGLRVVLLESQEHFGGAVGAHQVHHMLLDSGAESFATRNGAVQELAEELGLAEEIVAPTARGSWLYLPTGAVPMPTSGILGIPANPSEPGLRQALSAAGRRRAGLDRHLPRGLGTHERSLGGLVRARMGHQVLENLVAPVTLGIHSTHPDELDVDTVAPGLREGVRQYGSLGAAAGVLRAQAPAGSQVKGLRGGMNQLSEALIKDLSGRGVRLISGNEVIAVDRDETTGNWHVIRRQAGPASRRSVLSADALVLATDAPTATRLLGSVLPAGSLPHTNPGPEIALVTLVLQDSSLDRFPRGTGVLVGPEVREVMAKALTHANAKWDWVQERLEPGQHVLRLSYGREEQSRSGLRDGTGLPDEQLITLGLHDAAKIMGTRLGRAQLLGADVIRWTGAVPKVSVGHAERVRQVRQQLGTLPRLAAVGAWLSGTGLASLVPDTLRTIEGLDLGPRPPAG